MAEALILLELNHFEGVPSFERVSAEARGVRCYGCASRALALVASGAADAYVDVRKRLTAESYLAGAALVIGAGGTVVGLNGGPLQAVRSLTERVGLIAAASAQLAAELAERLGADHA